MSILPVQIEAARRQAQIRSSALNATAAIAQMDPHSREDLICYLQALSDAQAANDDDEMNYLFDAITEIFISEDDGQSPDLDAWETEADRTPQGRKARRQIHQESQDFIARYQQLKASAGLKTIREVADAAGLSPTTVQAIETQRVKPQAKTIQALAKAFKTTVAELFGE